MAGLTYSEAVERVARAISGAPFPSNASKAKARAAISEILSILAEPTEAMIDAGAQRLVRCGEGPCVWPDSYDALDVAAARQEAERVLLSGITSSPLKPEGK